jgi:hypothetical protein
VVQKALVVAGLVGGGAYQASELVARHFVALLAGGLVQFSGFGPGLGCASAAVDAV